MIEAASENEELKRKIFAQLCPVIRKDAIIASNTSSISITRLAASTDRPERFIGIHFMNPVPRMQLVELIRGIATEDDTFEASRDFIASSAKTSRSRRTFRRLSSTASLPMINEAVYTLYGGVGSVDAIDTAMRLGQPPDGTAAACRFHRLGYLPLCHAGASRGPGDSKYRPCPLLVKYVEAGWLGRKTQRGFYDYRSGTPVPTLELRPSQFRRQPYRLYLRLVRRAPNADTRCVPLTVHFQPTIRPEACPALVLNADYRPLSYYPLALVVARRDQAVFLDRVNIVSHYDKTVRSPSFE